jgi:prevent-host-death family protein
MTEVKSSDARNNLGALVSRLERGEEIVVTRRGQLIARLVSIE